MIKKKKPRSNSVKSNRTMELSNIFVPYKIYPASKYIPHSPLRCFQQLYLGNYYSSQIESFLSVHTYKPTQRGADLPWWGSKYFTDELGQRVMIISQDSSAEDAGSVVFWACLYTVVRTEDSYREFVQGSDSKRPFAFKSWNTILNQLLDWKIDLPFCYVTDASKVYKDGSWEDKDFDRRKSKELLEAEIEFCNPGIVILLGASPLSLVAPDKNYANVVDAGQPLWLRNKKFIVAPFFVGQGPVGNRSGKGFKKRLDMASELIKSRWTQRAPTKTRANAN